ncbi:BTAD domain-containing putative transcriptional regulator [Ilumatobacter coccineus]|uniref:OmpR/PhoB-type domain-containing protein n=1 Tax=Ilumatobacter coccineus (strain NBRC 103263 / KCTC 29153 / YM16-304) TaxID=1313172 RepID=A0A6C7E486_ILUCY|nr:BTAD domain-containing putative transcriptional regulator [Ilumatobacter coccineus]BAN01052.1 hypothetical protein YM304_07380 [Ilumatobacter coccineus YM16-304]
MAQVAGVSESDLDGNRLVVDVFGPTVVRVDGRPVELGRKQVRQLVAAFAVRRDWVSADALIDHLWADALPAHPRKALNVALSRLRSALGGLGERLEVAGNDYRLRTDSVDVERFTELIESARGLDRRAAVEAYEEALALWTAPPFSDEFESPAVVARRLSLEELRWFATVRLAELCNELGEPERAVEVSARLVDDSTVRERAVIAHATGLAMLGRKSEALSMVAAAVSGLRDQLGLEPSPGLLATEQALLAESFELEAGSVKRVRPDTGVFVGRAGELETLKAVEPGRSISVIAEAGTGKTALLDRFGELVVDAGGVVARVDVVATPERPLDTIAHLCLALCELPPPSGELDTTGEFAAALARICPELGIPRSGSLTRDALFDDLTRFVERRGRQAVIIVDDAHWIDSGSAEVLSRLIHRGRLAIVVGLRPVDDHRFDFLQVADESPVERADDAPAGRCEPLHLQPVERSDVVALVASRSTRAVDDAFIDDLIRASGGNTLFLRLLIDRWVEGRASDDELPSSILVTVSERLDLLAKSVVDTLQVAAALGSTFELHTIRQLRPNVDADLPAAVAAGIIRVDAASESASFVHAVVADACYQLLGEGRRIAIHEDIAFVLEGDRAAQAEIARHHVAAAPLDPERAVWTSIRAASEFIVGFDWETAAQHLDTAASLVDELDLDDVSLRAHVLVRRGAVGRALSSTDYLHDLFHGAELAREAGDDELFVVAVTEMCGHGQTTRAGDLDPRVAGLLDEALSLSIAPALRAELCAASVPLFSTSNQADRGRALYHEAWRIARDLGDTFVESAVIGHAHLGFAHPDDFELLAGAAQRMTDIAGNDADLIWEAAFVRFECSVIRGDAAAAQQAIDEMRLYTGKVGRRPRDFGMAFSESAHSRLRGELEAAERHAESALSIGLERFDATWALTVYGLLLLGIRREQGRAGELEAAIAEMLAGQPDYLPFHSVASVVAVESGELDVARAHIDVLARDRFGGIVRDVHYTSVILLAAPAVASVGEQGEIEALEALLRPFSGRMSWNGAASDGAIDGALALLASARGDASAAERYRLAAASLESRFRQLRSEISTSAQTHAS